MNMQTQEKAPDYLALAISRQLEEGKKVLWFVTGGSSIKVASEVSKTINSSPHLNNLTIMMTDERYGPVGHKDSNWQGLVNEGFDLPNVKQIPILAGDDIKKTAEKFASLMEGELKNTDYAIGLFGVGKDGHTAGILPGTPAVKAEALATSYHTEAFDRVTMTPKAIVKLNEVVVYMVGADKWPVVEDLLKTNKEIESQPVQILKQVPLLTIFSDYKII